jgi:hypothetical protein
MHALSLPPACLQAARPRACQCLAEAWKNAYNDLLAINPKPVAMPYSPAITRGKYKVLPLCVLTNQQRCICRIRTPTQTLVEQLLILELREDRLNSRSDASLERIRIRVSRVLCMRPRH